MEHLSHPTSLKIRPCGKLQRVFTMVGESRSETRIMHWVSRLSRLRKLKLCNQFGWTLKQKINHKTQTTKMDSKVHKHKTNVFGKGVIQKLSGIYGRSRWNLLGMRVSQTARSINLPSQMESKDIAPIDSVIRSHVK